MWYTGFMTDYSKIVLIQVENITGNKLRKF